MKAPEKENLHKYHRTRVKERFLRQGLDAFSPHELLELILFYAIPQKDTNELGHRLIATFGSIGGVMRASHEELCAVPDIGEHAATLLRLWLPATSFVLTDENNRKKKTYQHLNEIGEYFVKRYLGVTNETVYLMLLDNRYALIDCVAVHEGSVNSVSVTPRRLIEIAYRCRASMAVLAHNHPSGVAIPSSEDMTTTLSLREAFETMGIPLLEHILVAGDRFSPILLRSEKLLSSKVDRSAFYAGYEDYSREDGV